MISAAVMLLVAHDQGAASDREVFVTSIQGRMLLQKASDLFFADSPSQIVGKLGMAATIAEVSHDGRRALIGDGHSLLQLPSGDRFQNVSSAHFEGSKIERWEVTSRGSKLLVGDKIKANLKNISVLASCRNPSAVLTDNVGDVKRRFLIRGLAGGKWAPYSSLPSEMGHDFPVGNMLVPAPGNGFLVVIGENPDSGDYGSVCVLKGRQAVQLSNRKRFYRHGFPVVWQGVMYLSVCDEQGQLYEAIFEKNQWRTSPLPGIDLVPGKNGPMVLIFADGKYRVKKRYGATVGSRDRQVHDS